MSTDAAPKYVNNNQCQACPAGHTCNGTSQTTPCDSSAQFPKYVTDNVCTDCPAGSGKACAPGNEVCGPAFTNAPRYHLMSQNGCAEASRAVSCAYSCGGRRRGGGTRGSCRMGGAGWRKSGLAKGNGGWH